MESPAVNPPYVVEYDDVNFKHTVRDTRTNYIAHSFAHHPDAESCCNSMNSWVEQERARL